MSRMTDEKFLNSSAMICCDLWAQTRTQSTFEIVFSFSGYTKTRSWGNDPQSLIRCERRTENPSTKQRWTKRWQNEAGRSWSVIPFFLLQLTKCAVPSKVTAATKCIDVPSSVSTEKNDIVAFFLVYKPSTNKKIREQLCVCVWHWKGPVRQRYVRRDACGNVGMMSLSHTQTRQTSGLFHPSSWLTYLLPPLFLATVIQQQQRKKASLPHCFSARKKTRIRDRIVRMFFRQVWVGNPFDLKVIRHIATDWPQWQRIDVFLITCMTFSRWPGIKHTRI